MAYRVARRPMLCALLVYFASGATAQRIGQTVGSQAAYSFEHEKLNLTMLGLQTKQDLSPLQDLAISVSQLDLKAPLKARREYYAGFRLLSGGEYQDATAHLASAASNYPDFVAAHIALGFAYLRLQQNEQARTEFAKAIALDDHLPIAYLHLASAELALQHYSAAEEAVQKASFIAPVDAQVLAALAYTQLMNGDYESTIETAQRVHSGAHEGAGIVHYYAAAAWDARHDAEEAQLELETLLDEDPKSLAADKARTILAKITAAKEDREATPSTGSEVKSATVPSGQTPVESASNSQELRAGTTDQPAVKSNEICDHCAEKGVLSASKGKLLHPETGSPSVKWMDSGWSFRSSVDEVALIFAATDHGKAVSDLTQDDVAIRDNGKAPEVVTGFRNVAQLPLRLGLVIDTSESITTRFSFEQAAAEDFMRKVVTGAEDRAFVVGFSNSVLLVQDFTRDDHQISAAINKLAPAGGTALWDAVVFAADKLANQFEEHPVARVLVVISDGLDNSSRASLKNAIQAVSNGDVIFYAVSTREDLELTTDVMKDSASEGDHALKALAESTGGKVFFPGMIRNMDKSLGDLQQIIRSRYFVSYKPAILKRDNQYRPIEIAAQKSGHKLRVYTRKGYYPH